MKLQNTWVNWIQSSLINKFICILLAIISYVWPIGGIIVIYMSNKKGREDFKVFAELGILVALVVFIIRYIVYVL